MRQLSVKRPDRTLVAFASCSRTDLEQPLWAPLAQTDPDAFVWLGDIIYADSEDVGLHPRHYAAQAQVPGYVALKNTTPILGVWDDHDYGANDAGEEYVSKVESQQALLDFLEEPADSPRGTQEGVYAAYDVGQVPRQVRVVLLDTRYGRGASGTHMLSPAQWQWLEAVLTKSPAQVHIIGSRLPVITDDHPYERLEALPE